MCFPYAAGFQRPAKELTQFGVAVHAVEPPGRDIARPEEPLAEVTEIAERVSREIQDSISGPVLLWGHCCGVSNALATARLPEHAGRPPSEVSIGGILLEAVDALRVVAAPDDAATPEYRQRYREWRLLVAAALSPAPWS